MIFIVCVELEVEANDEEAARGIVGVALRKLYGPLIDGGITCVLDPNAEDEEED